MKLTRREAMGALAGGVFAGLASDWRLPRALADAVAGGGPQYDTAPGRTDPFSYNTTIRGGVRASGDIL